MQMNILLRNSPEHIYNFALNCGFFRLNLPAVKIRSVVGNGELEIAPSTEGDSLDYKALRSNLLPGFTAALPSRHSGQSSGS